MPYQSISQKLRYDWIYCVFGQPGTDMFAVKIYRRMNGNGCCRLFAEL